MLGNMLSRGCPPAREFIHLPQKVDLIECRSASRRSAWTMNTVVLYNDQLLLYRVRAAPPPHA